MLMEVLPDDIVSVVHSEKDVTVIMSNGKRFFNEMSYYSALRIMDENFLRINKSTIVNLTYVTRINKNILYMANDENYEIEKEYLNDTMNLFYKLKLRKFQEN